MNWRILTLALAGLGATGCDDQVDVPERTALNTPTAPATAALVPTRSATTPAPAPTPAPTVTQTPIAKAPTPVDTPAHKQSPLEGLTAEFPWGNGKDGNWTGTKATDPADLAKISDADMLARAMGEAEVQLDREHALVSIGRRRLSGAMAAYTKGMSTSEPLPIREMTLSGLIEHGGPEALPLMWQMLRDDPSAQVRGQAIWAVSLYGEGEARKAIDAGMADEELGVRNMAVLAIWALKDSPDDAMSLLESAASSEEQMIFQEAFYNLSRMPWSRAGRTLSEWALNAKGPKQKTAIFYYRAWVRKFPDLRK